jgi:acetyltransferase-like isoleucine patch superfamily enzyme
MSAAKKVLSALLRPAAKFVSGPGTSIRRAWAHARFSSSIDGRLDASVVVQGVPEVQGTGRIKVGRNLFLYRELYLETEEEGVIELGDDVVMSRGVHVVSFSRVSIGKGAMIGEYVSIRDANHRIDNELPIRDSGHQTAPITIGPNAWVGRGVTVLAGVTIGAGAIVGANAVVTRDLPPFSIAVGIPARVVKQRSVHHEAVGS